MILCNQPDPTYWKRVNEQMDKTIKMLNWIAEVNLPAMKGITKYNPIDTISVLIVEDKLDMLYLHCGEDLMIMMMKYFSLPDIEEYEKSARIRDLLLKSPCIIERNKVSL